MRVKYVCCFSTSKKQFSVSDSSWWSQIPRHALPPWWTALSEGGHCPEIWPDRPGSFIGPRGHVSRFRLRPGWYVLPEGAPHHRPRHRRRQRCRRQCHSQIRPRTIKDLGFLRKKWLGGQVDRWVSHAIRWKVLKKILFIVSQTTDNAKYIKD